MKPIRYIYLLALAILCACSDDAPQGEPNWDDGIYIAVDLDSPESRLAYEFDKGSGLASSGRIKASWELGDIIKVYESGQLASYADPPSTKEEYCYSDAYANYDAYAAAWPYPSAPLVDTYYRFVCVGGAGTPHGVFKYIGLATARVVDRDGIRNVNVNIKYGHAIKDWDRFQGLAIYGNPLRNIMMRTQVAKNDLTHLKFGERMYAYVCAHNFQWGIENPLTEGAGLDRLVFRNVGGCVYRIIIGGVDTDVHGGSVLSLSMPADFPETASLSGQDMTLTLGSADELQLGIEPWLKVENEGDAFCAYIVGWPGTLAANATATVTLHEHVSGITYTWDLSKAQETPFQPGLYYTIDLRDHEYTKQLP